MAKYSVDITRTICNSTTIVVEAKSKAEAEELALDSLVDSLDSSIFDPDNATTDDSVIEVTKIK